MNRGRGGSLWWSLNQVLATICYVCSVCVCVCVCLFVCLFVYHFYQVFYIATHLGDTPVIITARIKSPVTSYNATPVTQTIRRPSVLETIRNFKFSTAARPPPPDWFTSCRSFDRAQLGWKPVYGAVCVSRSWTSDLVNLHTWSLHWRLVNLINRASHQPDRLSETIRSRRLRLFGHILQALVRKWMIAWSRLEPQFASFWWWWWARLTQFACTSLSGCDVTLNV